MNQSQDNFQDYMPEIHLKDYLQVIMRRRWIIIAFFTVLVTTVIIGTLKQTPIYEGVSTIRIEHKSPHIVSVQEVSPMGTGGNYAYKDYYETQYKLIKSRTLLTKVVQSVGLKPGNSNIESDPVSKLIGVIKVKPVRNSQLVEISARDPSPVMAAKIANAVAGEFVRQNLERNINAASDAAEWLSKRIEEQRQKLRDSEIKLQEYREKNNLNILPQVSGDNANGDIKAEYARLQALFANYSQRYTDEHPKMIELKAQINSLKNKIQGLEDVKMGGKTMEYRVLERDVQTNKRMYEILLNRLKEIDLSGSLNVNNISIIDRAQIPPEPIKPNVKLNIILSIMVGFVGGIGLAFFIDYLDTTIKSPDDVKEILGAHFIGAIPDIAEKEETKKDKIMHLDSYSPTAESYRAIRTEIYQLMGHNNRAKTILITSAAPKAGKTMTVSNLSIALAQEGKRVLLVDSDLRKPQLDRIFNLDKSLGLGEYLTAGVNINSIIKDTEIENLKVVTSGKNVRNSAEIIGSSKFEWFIGEVKSRFDFILFDSPPVISVTDAVVLAGVVDGLIQIVRSGKSLLPVVKRAKEKLVHVKARNLGVILNGVKAYHGDYYYYSKYYYGQDSKRRKTQETAV